MSRPHFFLAPNVRMRLGDDGRFDELIMYDGDLVAVAHVKMEGTRSGSRSTRSVPSRRAFPLRSRSMKASSM